ncbi:hypothetical protein BDV98DRAFT_565051 [Pterulicium gracile]|uniref:Uncharacterized protein n=1 Tax=Pterulicium gracile TaxID=1884261 RepID=A0A5C3QX33_9AGAR|nr:hypothetical protein BDV98DRAFT_565051 [Pterula gracilis]
MPPRKRKHHPSRPHSQWAPPPSSEQASNEYFAVLSSHSSNAAAAATSSRTTGPTWAAHGASWNEPVPVHPSADPDLFIQAYEADVFLGPQAADSARAMEYSTESGPGDALLAWEGASHAQLWPGDDDDVIHVGSGADQGGEGTKSNAVWVDRYDARLLLNRLPESSSPLNRPDSPSGRPSSPSGWTDLPSDTEDAFFLSPSEVLTLRQTKKRQDLDRLREERLAALQAEDEEELEEEDEWGGSDEEPDDAQKVIMTRTAQHLSKSPNPAQLEARILTNHGSDPRFTFLRGRWGRAWNLMRGKARMNAENEAKVKEGGMGGLGGYGDSDEDEESEAVEVHDVELGAVDIAIEVCPVDEEEAKKEARRRKAREWAEQRKKAAQQVEDLQDS